jgi:hypothetical protein
MEGVIFEGDISALYNNVKKEHENVAICVSSD